MAGVDLPTLKELMGHSTITMTMRYVQSDARAQAGSGKEARAVQCRAVVCPVRAEGVPTKVPTVGNQLRSRALLNY